MQLKFRGKKHLASDIWQFEFDKPTDFEFKAGQFNQYTIKQPHPDGRGVRRWFTISASPTEDYLSITTRIFDEHSTFKEALNNLRPGETIKAEGPDGDFLLPDDTTPVVWIAGGIGVTPFRSQLKWLIDTEKDHDITLLYGNRTPDDICFSDLFDRAKTKVPSFKLANIVQETASDWQGKRGLIDETAIRESVGDLGGKLFYVSGPEPMVEAFKPKLIAMGIAENSIKQDWFPGYTDEF